MFGFILKIRNFMIMLLFFYVFPFVSALLALLGVYKDIQIAWSSLASKFLRVKYHKLEGSKEMKSGKTLYLVNHRCQGDFFIHNFVLNGCVNVLSRMMVAIIFPGFLMGIKTIWFFNRSGNTNPQKFNEWMDKKWSQSHRQGVLVYPQGHRMQGSKKCDQTKLKTGLIRYAYRKQAPIQIVMSFGNQDVFDQKRIHCAFNQDVYYSFGDTIDPKDFQNQNQFVLKAKESFCLFFDQIFAKYQAQKNRKKQK